MSIQETRRTNLRRLIKERYNDVQARFAAAMGKKATYVYQLLTEGPHGKGMGEDVARHIETMAGLPTYWLDTDRDRPALSLLQGSYERSNQIPLVRIEDVAQWETRPTPDMIMRARYDDACTSKKHGDTAMAVVVPPNDYTMAEEFLPAELVVVDPEVMPANSDVVLATCEGRMVIRRYLSGPGGAVMLSARSDSAMPLWSDRVKIAIIGVVVEHHRYRSRWATPAA